MPEHPAVPEPHPPNDERLTEVLLAWEDSVAAEQPRSPADLCRDCPELIEAATREIQRLTEMDRFLFPQVVGVTAGPLPHSAPAPRSQPFPNLPGYQILEEIGQGGMGVVYQARQHSLQRLVAIKTLVGHRWSQPAAVARLRHEARVLSRLDHPQIVQVYDVLETDASLSIVLEYVAGESLAHRLEGKPLPPRSAAEMLRNLACTIATVHAQGLLHRDLKPANVLVNHTGEIKITDFGIAREIDSPPGLTMTGEFLGSPPYVAPEQIDSQGLLDVRTDVYGLGATLYELLTGRPPFVGGSVVETLDQVRDREPVPPRILQPGIPPDLDAICLKCLEKDPERRYDNADQLVDDLESYLAGRPTRARPLSLVDRGARWLRRHPTQAAVAGIVAAAVAAVVSVGTWSAARISGAEREGLLKDQALAAERKTVRLQKFNLLTARIRERSLNRPRGWSTDNLADLQKLEAFAPDQETQRMMRSEALRALCTAELARTRVLLQDFDNYGLVYSPNGKILAAGQNRCEDGRAVVRLFAADSYTEQKPLAFDRAPLPPDSDHQAAHVEGVRSLLFTPDSSRLIVGTRSGMVHVWNLGTRTMERAWQAHKKYVVALGLLQDSQVLASLSEDSSLRFWDISSGQLLDKVEFPDQRMSESLAVAGNSVYFVAQESLREIIWDPGSHQARRGWQHPAHIGRQVALFPDQRTVFCLGSSLVQHDALSGQIIRRLTDLRHVRPQVSMHGLDFSADGHWAASSGSDGIKVWDVLSGTLLPTIPNSSNQRISTAFRPQGRELAVALDGRIETWQIAERGVWETSLCNSFALQDADLSADGRTLAGTTKPSDDTGESLEQDALLITGPGAQHQLLAKRFVGGGPVKLSPDGQTVACAGFDAFRVTLELFDRAAPASFQVVNNNRSQGDRVAFAPDARHLWYANADDRTLPGYLACVRTADGREICRFVNERSEREQRRSRFFSVAAGETTVVASSVDETVRFFDPETGELRQQFSLPGRTIDALCLTANESRVVCGTREGRLLLLDVATGGKLADVLVHDDWITAVCATAQGLIFSAGRDGTLAAWQGDDGLQELFRLGPLSRGIQNVVISRDGTQLMVQVESETGVRLLRIDELRRQLKKLALNW